MKRLLILILLCICLMGFQFIGGKSPTVDGGGADSCSGTGASTYLYAWGGENASGEDYICYNSGGSSAAANLTSGTPSISATEAETGSFGHGVNAQDEGYRWWTGIEFDEDSGTTWCSIYINNATITGNVAILEQNDDSNSDNIRMFVDADGFLNGNYKGDNVGARVTGNDAISGQTWTRAGYTWDDTANNHCVQVGSNGWDCDPEALTTPTTAISLIAFGEHVSGTLVTHEIWLDNVSHHDTWQTADPGIP